MNVASKLQNSNSEADWDNPKMIPRAEHTGQQLIHIRMKFNGALGAKIKRFSLGDPKVSAGFQAIRYLVVLICTFEMVIEMVFK